MRINKNLLVATIFFFFNSFLLPLGLLYTTLLTPVFYISLLLKRYKHIILKYIIVLLPFSVIHFINGVIIKDYFRSVALYFTVYIFIFIVYDFLKTKNYLDIIFNKITNINFALTVVALLSLFTPLRTLWSRHPVSSNINDLPRLSLFTYEPSYYSTLLVPLIFYYILAVSVQKDSKSITKLLALGFSMILSFSLGVIASVAIAFTLLILFNLHKLKIKRDTLSLLIYISILAILVALLLLVFYPDNPLYMRIINVFTGKDTSGKGRTFEAFQIAYLLIEERSVLWGIGLGQIKNIGYDIITEFYDYDKTIIKSVAIPNAFAETLAIFGFVGAFIRIAIQIYLYFKTKVYNNYFQMLCFFYIFIYQFTGSFITNIAEYIIWLLAFIPYFRQFDVSTNSKITQNKTSNKLNKLNEDSVYL